MIRLIIRIQDCGAAAHIDGAKADIMYKTFDLHNDELQDLLKPQSYGTALIVGAEVKP